MVFTDIRLQNFRSYTDASFDLGEGVTIVVGPNGAGKTNLLEAVMLAATGKTYRQRNSLINAGKEWARVDVHTLKNQQRSAKLRTGEEKPALEVEIDKKIYKRLPFDQKQPVVLFEPNHLFLLHGEPSERRNSLDDLAEQLVAGYDKTRLGYKRTLAQRNSLLKKDHLDKTVLFALNVRLSELASQIVAEREKLIGQINSHLSKIYSDISAEASALKLEYKPSAQPKNYSANLIKKLEHSLELDRMRGHTQHGPHREDFDTYLNGELAAATASRGEIRTLILTLKIIELQLLEEKLGIRPTLLLDDVFSELDGARRKALVGYLINHQTIITTTDADIVTKNFSQKSRIIPL